jgi:hypothetical protein
MKPQTTTWRYTNTSASSTHSKGRTQVRRVCKK